MKLVISVFLLLSVSVTNSAWAVIELKTSEILNLQQEKIANKLAQQIGFSKIEVSGAFVQNSYTQNSAAMNSKPDPTLIEIVCDKNLEIRLYGDKSEAVASVFYSFRKIGFLFPKPNLVIAPKAGFKKICGQKIWWKPRFRDRGFHLHTQHPSEFVNMIFMQDLEIQESYLSWLLVNGQNTLQIQMLRNLDEHHWKNLNQFIQRAKNYGFNVGLGISFSMIQQNSYYLIEPWRSIFNWGSGNQMSRNLKKLQEKVKIDFLTIEIGTTEFSSTDYQRTLDWIELAKWHSSVPVFFKVHASSNQFQEPWGNFNFLPAQTKKSVGLLPHTIHFYGLQDVTTPVYGRSDFYDMADFIQRERTKKLIWYFPETSYYIGLDIDVPLFLTDYLVARAEDMQFLEQYPVAGHLNFTTGIENGYWLFDWALMLWTDMDNPLSPELPLTILGEESSVVRPLIQFQTKWVKHQQLIQLLSSENLMDQIPFVEPIHRRVLMRNLLSDQETLIQQISKLDSFLREFPSYSGLKNMEFKLYYELLHLRAEHALAIRKAFLNSLNGQDLWDQPIRIEQRSLEVLRQYPKLFPKSIAWQKRENVTVYDEGYAYTAHRLHYWIREREVLKNRISNPFFMNIYDPIKIIFGTASPTLPKSLHRHLVQ